MGRDWFFTPFPPRFFQKELKTLENCGQIEDIPTIVEVATALNPFVIFPTQIENKMETIRAAKNSTIKENRTDLVINLLFPFFGNKEFIFP